MTCLPAEERRLNASWQRARFCQTMAFFPSGVFFHTWYFLDNLFKGIIDAQNQILDTFYWTILSCRSDPLLSVVPKFKTSTDFLEHIMMTAATAMTANLEIFTLNFLLRNRPDNVELLPMKSVPNLLHEKRPNPKSIMLFLLSPVIVIKL